MLVFQIQLEFGRLFDRKIGGLPACDPPRSILIAPTSVHRAGLCRTAVAGIVAYVARLFPDDRRGCRDYIGGATAWAQLQGGKQLATFRSDPPFEALQGFIRCH